MRYLFSKVRNDVQGYSSPPIVNRPLPPIGDCVGWCDSTCMGSCSSSCARGCNSACSAWYFTIVVN